MKKKILLAVTAVMLASGAVSYTHLDVYKRQRLYYIEGLTWAQVAYRMNNLFPKRKVTYTEENCRKRNFRFFEENLKMSPNVPLKCDKT